MGTSAPTFAASTISLNLRIKVFSWVRYSTLMYCWVMVDPPPVSDERVTMPSTARAMPGIDTPGSVQKVRFSRATAASVAVLGISA